MVWDFCGDFEKGYYQGLFSGFPMGYYQRFLGVFKALGCGLGFRALGLVFGFQGNCALGRKVLRE